MSGNRVQTRAMLVLVAGVVVYLTLKPFVFRVPESFRSIGQAVFSYDHETLQHIVPAVVIMMLVRAGWGLGPRRAACVSFAGLVVLEAVQLFIEQRHARAGDLLAQVVGLAIGGRLPVRPLPRGAWRALWSAVLVGWTALTIAAGVRGQFGHTLGPMDTTFRLVVGDEHTGGRPWLGEVHRLVIATDASPGPLVSLGPPPAEGVWQGGGRLPVALTRAEHGWTSGEAVPELCRAIDEASEITVEIDATPASGSQTGPARLVTISKGLAYRNLTVGQEGDALVVRVRTPRSGPNASMPQFVFPGVFTAGERVPLRIWTDGGSARLWMGDSLVGERFSYTTPRDWLGLKPGPADAAGVIALFAPLGLAAGALAGGGRSRRIPARVWIAGTALPIVTLAVIWSTATSLDRPVAWWLLPSAIVASTAGVAAAARLRGRR